VDGVGAKVTQRVKQWVIGVCWGVVWLLSGCASSAVSLPAPKEQRVPLPSAEYRIGPEDVLEIVVWKNAELSKTVTVRPDGIITLPLTDDIRASGLTAEQVRDEIKRGLQRFLDVPEITVTVADVRSYNVYILGEVQRPGKYQTKSQTTLLQVIAMAGGFTTFANPDEIVVVRQTRQGAQQRIRAKYKDLVRQGDIGLQPGDTIIVP
jgi:polysaccharide export outer membrane protein